MVRGRILINAVGLLVFACIGIAGLAKAMNASVFLGALQTWTLLPGALHPLLAVGVPALEIGLSTAFMLGIRRRRCAIIAQGMLLVFAFMYALQLLLAAPPNCDCFGLLARYHALRADGPALVVRNLALAAALAPIVLSRGSPPIVLAPTANDTADVGRSGHTLLEVLLVIALVGVLLALSLPTLGRVRGQAYDAVALSELRQHALVFESYSADHASRYPHFTDPSRERTPLTVGDLSIEMSYFDAAIYWNIELAEYYDGAWWSESFLAPDDPNRGPTYYSTYLYSSTFITDPKYWNPSTRVVGATQWRSTRAGDVRYPSLKGLLLDWHSAWRSRRLGDSADPPRSVRIGFADASARLVPLSDVLEWYPGGDGASDYNYQYIPMPVMHTIDGLDGRDVR